MVNVCFAGITGWTAPPIVTAIDQAGDLTLAAGVSRSAAGQSLAAVTGSSSGGLVYATVTEALASAEVDVLVDYTSAAAVRDNAWDSVEAGVHVVIGSSGLTAGDYPELDRLARAQARPPDDLGCHRGERGGHRRRVRIGGLREGGRVSEPGAGHVRRRSTKRSMRSCPTTRRTRMPCPAP